MYYGPTNKFSTAQGDRLRGTDQQVGNLLLGKPATYRSRNIVAADAPNATRIKNVVGMKICHYELQNRSGSTAVLGIGFRLNNKSWIAGQWDNSETQAFLVDTADAQSNVAGSFALETTTINDGFVIASRVPFNWISIDVTTASIGAALEHVVRYTNAAGTGWTNLVAGIAWLDTLTSVAAGDVWATGEQIFAWPARSDWGKLTAPLNGIPSGYYAINVRATDAGTTAALAGGIEIGTFGAVAENITDNQVMSDSGEASLWEPNADGIVALFSVSNAGNHAKAEWVHEG